MYFHVLQVTVRYEQGREDKKEAGNSVVFNTPSVTKKYLLQKNKTRGAFLYFISGPTAPIYYPKEAASVTSREVPCIGVNVV